MCSKTGQVRLMPGLERFFFFSCLLKFKFYLEIFNGSSKLWFENSGQRLMPSIKKEEVVL